MYKFDSDTFIRELESLEGVEETPMQYEEYEHERMNERELKNDL